MAYLHHLDNLYKKQDILLFKECYALEKIDGTSVKIDYKEGNLSFHSDCITYHVFKALFNEATIKEFLDKHFAGQHVEIYGEGYGGKIQKMSDTYGKDTRAIFFEVVVNDKHLSVPNAEEVITKMGLEFVYYKLIPTTMEAIDAEKLADSQQAIRNGCGVGHKREGIVLRPLVEVRLNNGERVIAKHKNDEWRETATPRVIDDVNKLKVVEAAELVAFEWVTEERLSHVLQNFPNPQIEQTPFVLKAMADDVLREAVGEIKVTDEVVKAIKQRTVKLFKEYLKKNLI